MFIRPWQPGCLYTILLVLNTNRRVQKRDIILSSIPNATRLISSEGAPRARHKADRGASMLRIDRIVRSNKEVRTLLHRQKNV